MGQGKIYFHQGRSAWPSKITLQDYPTDGLSATLHGERPKAYLGAGLAHGNFNGEGIPDLATASRFAARPGPLSQQATVYIIWGGQELVNGPIDNPALAHCTIVPPAENQLAMWVHTANFDRDAFDELILTLSNAEVDGVERAGAGFILWGAKDWPQSIDLANWQQASNVTRLVSHRYGAYMTARLATGDFDGSGVIDLAAKVYVPGWRPGLVHVYHDPFKGRPKFFDYFDQKHRTTVIADKHLSHDNFPYNLASLDWNDDGLDDLVISNTLAHREWPRLASEGVVYVVHGSPTLPDSIDLRTNNAKWDVIWGGSHVADIGESMAKSDLDSDGKDDLIIGAWTATTNAGE